MPLPKIVLKYTIALWSYGLNTTFRDHKQCPKRPQDQNRIYYKLLWYL